MRCLFKIDLENSMHIDKELMFYKSVVFFVCQLIIDTSSISLTKE